MKQKSNATQNNSLDVRIHLTSNAGKTRGYASVNIGNDFAVKNLRIIEGSKGLFVAMPSVKNHKNEYEDVFFPISKESREKLNNAVIAAYEQKLQQADSHKQEQEQEQEQEQAQEPEPEQIHEPVMSM